MNFIPIQKKKKNNNNIIIIFNIYTLTTPINKMKNQDRSCGTASIV